MARIMVHFTGRGILLDIEGTTSSIRYVYDVLFPFARSNLRHFLQENWDVPQVVEARDQVARDLGHASYLDWCPGDGTLESGLERLCAEVNRLMDADVKATGLKQLQGLIWREGYESQQLTSHVYDDVPPALKRWSQAGLDIRIFSSGSATAQKLFFAHTEHGNLLPFFKGHYDTKVGSKTDSASYEAISRDMNLPPARILFVSDVVAELDAAQAAGMATALSIRPGNRMPGTHHDHAVVAGLDEIGVG